MRVLKGLSAKLSTALLAGAITQSAAVTGALAQQAGEIEDIKIGYLQWAVPQQTLAFADTPADDHGLGGARKGIEDNNTTGKFTKQNYVLIEKKVTSHEEVMAAAEDLAAQGATMVVAELPAEEFLAVADLPALKDGLVFNVWAKEDSLREENCRMNAVHVAPTYSMLADGLAQYLIWKRWPRWFLLSGSLPKDTLWADALKRSATRFGGEIVEERFYEATDTSRRVDSGHTQVQRQIPVFTQNAPEYDVALVADESEIFGTYIPYRLWDAKPVAGSAGLMPTEWTPAHEQWGGYQMQNRFYELNKRVMRAVDANAWSAIRIIGEGATRAKTNDPAKIREFVLGPKLEIAAFKGEKLTIRDWNHQLRQPILLTDGRTVVSVSPQEGFLHERTELDTLGIDKPETACVLK